MFSGVGKTDAELDAGLDAGIGEFNAESEDEVRRLAALAAARSVVARVTLRVNPDIDARSHPYISTGLRENKFGVDIREAYLEYDRAFAPVPHRVCYALKANGSGAILRLLSGLGAGADIVSG